MITLYKYLEESLLDDLDDLENDVDNTVAKAGTIGSDYKITWIEDWIGAHKLDRKKLKELGSKSVWNQTDFNSHRTHSPKPPTKAEILLCNIILSLNKSALECGDYTDVKQNNDIYNTLDILFQKHFKELHKSALHFSKDAKKETFSVNIEKSMLVGYVYIRIEIGSSGHYINICLKKK